MCKTFFLNYGFGIPISTQTELKQNQDTIRDFLFLLNENEVILLRHRNKTCLKNLIKNNFTFFAFFKICLRFIYLNEAFKF
jgi:hypothetical protein